MMDVGFTKTEIALVLKALFTASAVGRRDSRRCRDGATGLAEVDADFRRWSGRVQLPVLRVGRWRAKSYPLMIAAVSIDNMAGSTGNIASVALIMALCDVRYSAFQYALLSAIALTPRYLARRSGGLDRG